VKKPTNVIKFKQRCLTPQQWMDRDIELPDTLLGDLFSTTSRILFSADTGLGKTMLGMAWAFALGLGQHFLHWRSIRKTRVLYIDGKMPRDLMQERIELACEWFDVDPPKNGLKFLSREDYEDMEPLDTEDGQKWLDRFIEREGPFNFIIFDNIMSLCSAIMKEEESWQSLKPYALSLTKRHIGQLWLHHTGHDKSRAYGTKTREWQMDTVMVGEVVDQDHVSFNLNFTKARRREPSNGGDFRNEHIELRDGQWVHRAPEIAATGRPNKSEEIALKALRYAIAQADDDAPERLWRDHAYKLGISASDKENTRSIAFRRARDALIESGKVKLKGDKYSIVE
jgi:AAA domain